MIAYSAVSFMVNVYVLARLSKCRSGEVHLRASYIRTRADVMANIAMFALTSFRFVDLLAGEGIGVYVLREAFEILPDAREREEDAPGQLLNARSAGLHRGAMVE